MLIIYPIIAQFCRKKHTLCCLLVQLIKLINFLNADFRCVCNARLRHRRCVRNSAAPGGVTLVRAVPFSHRIIYII